MIKELSERKAALKSFNTKCLETLENYFKYKEFLDKLTDEEALKRLKIKKEERKMRRENNRKNKNIKVEPHKIKFETYNLQKFSEKGKWQ